MKKFLVTFVLLVGLAALVHAVTVTNGNQVITITTLEENIPETTTNDVGHVTIPGAGKFTVVASGTTNQLVFISSGGTTNVIDADIDS